MWINNAELFPVEFLKQCILCHSLLSWEELRGKRKGEWKGNSIINFLQFQYTLGKFYSHRTVLSLASGEEGTTNWDVSRSDSDPRLPKMLMFWSGALIYWGFFFFFFFFFSQLQASSYFVFTSILKEDHCSLFFFSFLIQMETLCLLRVKKKGKWHSEVFVVKPG